MSSETKEKEHELYQKTSFNIPIAFLDQILDYMESEYAIFPIMKDCFGIGNDNEEVCKKWEKIVFACGLTIEEAIKQLAEEIPKHASEKVRPIHNRIREDQNDKK